ncbi:four-helix bundle copper-binding protein [Halococcoides cellulosivorans]|uniref:Four-helix bundle copper-binding protein n=1 Tax=Halococcoides cellulosivorans TaxID=1679096 RepID=A0A2R4X3P4_9EURY|nr:four-helix bundle copper-binding protein [Halococcoides cellulosivorans]AWB28323.1 four-helix bundle copper-binding protein [Halococcoides cellulosivorans]
MALSESGSSSDHLNDDERDCIDLCTEAATLCEWCADECLGDAEMEDCARLCRDVADIASLHARLLARNSTSSSQIATICADLSETCAEECAQHDADHCQACAELLPEAAESCRQMATP